MTFAKSARLLLILGAAALISGCSAVRTHKGAVVDPQLATAIQPGIDNKDSVAKTLGRPSFTGEFTPNDWYYVSRDTTQFAFGNPRVSRQTVYLVRFDPAGNVSSVGHLGKEWIFAVNPNSRRTPTLGRKRGFFEELFGNVGTVGSVGNSPGY